MLIKPLIVSKIYCKKDLFIPRTHFKVSINDVCFVEIEIPELSNLPDFFKYTNKSSNVTFWDASVREKINSPVLDRVSLELLDRA